MVALARARSLNEPFNGLSTTVTEHGEDFLRKKVNLDLDFSSLRKLQNCGDFGPYGARSHAEEPII